MQSSTIISKSLSNDSDTRSVGFALGNTERFNLVVGVINKNTELFKEGEKLRSTKSFNEVRDKQKLDNLIKPIKKILGDYLVLRSVVGFESTYIEAPNQHHISNVHSDCDEYGPGITLLFYPRVDETIVSGRLLIMDEAFDNIDSIKDLCESINTNVGESIASYERMFDNENNDYENVLCINNKITSDGYLPFVSFDTNILHQVEKIDGTGIREALFLSLDAIYKDF